MIGYKKHCYTFDSISEGHIELQDPLKPIDEFKKVTFQ
jgi:hypothetical protein